MKTLDACKKVIDEVGTHIAGLHCTHDLRTSVILAEGVLAISDKDHTSKPVITAILFLTVFATTEPHEQWDIYQTRMLMEVKRLRKRLEDTYEAQT